MKKLFSFVLALALLLSLTVCAAAAGKNSPTKPDRPTIDEDSAVFLDDSEEEIPGCVVSLDVTELPEVTDQGVNPGAKKRLNDAEDSYVSVYSGEVWSILRALDGDGASEWNPRAQGKKLSIANIIDVVISCTKGDEHYGTTHAGVHKVKMKLINADDYVGLLNYDDATGNWSYIPSSLPDEDGCVTIIVPCQTEGYTFAVVEGRRSGHHDGGGEGEPTSPQTGEMSQQVCAFGALFFTAIGSTVLYKGKKRA